MGIYSLAMRTVNVTTNNACVELRSVANRARVYEVGVCLVSASATVIALGRSLTLGTTPTAPVLGLAEDAGDQAALTSMCVSWATGPVTPANFFRRFGANTIGAGIVWTFPRGLVLNATTGIILDNILGGSILDVWMVWDE